MHGTDAEPIKAGASVFNTVTWDRDTRCRVRAGYCRALRGLCAARIKAWIRGVGPGIARFQSGRAIGPCRVVGGYERHVHGTDAEPTKAGASDFNALIWDRDTRCRVRAGCCRALRGLCAARFR